MTKLGKFQSIMWSIALPGFSQLLTGQYFKGTLFVLSEITINVCSHFNKAIMLSFLGEFSNASSIVDYQWLMSYAFLYFFAMWDAYKYEMPENEELAFLPFASAAAFVTLGLIYSNVIKFFGQVLGPVFTPMIFVIPGLASGFVIRYLLLNLSLKYKIKS
ncbi:hypothetical protein [Bacillus sp. B1-b2]|uniref:hypothetical protein n=1 Tax=Bacillus sp. B1-b2 TaxID=2653201 RepID=UPI0012620D21|nr:hypothetical protein [Bacillus sp. B1-b2]KAB7669937.1 hypothetical protein F9279_09330 [Bacillus sp. B1-b2]